METIIGFGSVIVILIITWNLYKDDYSDFFKFQTVIFIFTYYEKTEEKKNT